MEVNLITTYYKAQELDREKENIFVLNKNLTNTSITFIYIFLQNDDLPAIDYNLFNHKIIFIHHGTRPSFRDLFLFANKLQNIKIVANSDIFFDFNLELLKKALKKWDILALTRWDYNDLSRGGVFFNNYKSQDSWIYLNPVQGSIGDFLIGQYGCDNRLLHEFKKIGLKVGNPSFSIKTLHFHESNLRTYLNNPNYESVPPPYNYILPRYIKFNILFYKNKYYTGLRYQYYKSIKNNNLISIDSNIIVRLIAVIKMFFYSKLYNIYK